MLGMHRSGTSAASNLISIFGCDLPKTLMQANDNNKKGYYESSKIFSLNERILKSSSSKWDDWTEFNPSWLDSPHYHHYLSEAKNILEAEYGDSPLFVIKDPRICKVFPFWKSVFESINVELKVLLTVRNPSDVKRSLNLRNSFNEEYSEAIWLRHVLDAEFFTREEQRTVVIYPNYISQWKQVYRKLSDDFDLQWPVSVNTAEEQASEFLDARLSHHNTTDADSDTRQSDSDSTFKIISSWSKQKECETDYQQLDLIRNRLNSVDKLFSKSVNKLNDLDRIIETRDSEILRLRQELNSLKDENSQISEKCAAAEKLQSDLLKKHTVLQEECNSLEEQKDKLLASSNNNHQHLVEQSEKLDQLVKRIDSIDDHIKWISDSKPTRKDIEGLLCGHNTSLEKTIQKQLTPTPSSDLSKLKEKLTKLEEESSTRTKELSDLKRKLYISQASVEILSGDMQPGNQWRSRLVSPLIKLMNRRKYYRLSKKLNFSTADYLSLYSDIEKSGILPIWHYLNHGITEGRLPNKTKDTEPTPTKGTETAPSESIDKIILKAPNEPSEGPRKKLRNGDLKTTIAKSGLFDGIWYKEKYRLSNMTTDSALEHFLESGLDNDLKPNALFEPTFYRQANYESDCDNTYPLIHYINIGEKQMLDPGRLFSARFYANTYQDVKKAKVSLLGHYLNYGWKEKRRHHPSFSNPQSLSNRLTFMMYFDRYLQSKDSLQQPLIPQMPLVPEDEAKVMRTVYSDKNNARKIVEETQKKTGKKYAICSVNFGGRDPLRHVRHISDADIFLFTDKCVEKSLGWQALPIDYYEHDCKRLSLYYKTHLLDYFNCYEYILWIDQNVSPTFDSIQQFIGNKNLANCISSYVHWGRNCLYKEAKEIIASGRAPKKEVEAQIDRYRADDYPTDQGLFETNVLWLPAKSKDSEKLLKLWWQEIAKGVARDQLSFTYALWKLKLHCQPIEKYPTTSRNSNLFNYINHD